MHTLMYSLMSVSYACYAWQHSCWQIWAVAILYAAIAAHDELRRRRRRPTTENPEVSPRN